MANGLTYMRTVSSVADTKQLAASLVPYLHAADVIVLNGELGAGKTQFVQGLAAALEISEPVVSPTFNILLPYADGVMPLYHFDLYRLEKLDDLEDIGFYETLEHDGVSVVEWGNKFEDLLLYDYLEIEIGPVNSMVQTPDKTPEEDKRCIVAHSFGTRSRALLYVWANDETSQLVAAPW